VGVVDTDKELLAVRPGATALMCQPEVKRIILTKGAFALPYSTLRAIFGASDKSRTVINQ